MCRNDEFEWHKILEKKLALLKEPHPKSYLEELLVEIDKIKSEHVWECPLKGMMPRHNPSPNLRPQSTPPTGCQGLPFNEELFTKVIAEMSPTPDKRAVMKARRELTERYDRSEMQLAMHVSNPNAALWDPSEEELDMLLMAGTITREYLSRYIPMK